MSRRFVRQALAVALGLSSAAPVLAQGRAFGVKGGVDLSTQRVTPAGGAADRLWFTNLVAGGFYTQPLLSRVDLQADGLYAVKGSRLRIAGLTETVQIDYFEVPVVARAHLGAYYVEAGASAAVRLRARARIPFPGSTESVDIAGEVARADYGAIAGGGAEFGRFVFDVRYTHGIKDVDADTTDASHTKNRAVAITAGVKF